MGSHLRERELARSALPRTGHGTGEGVVGTVLNLRVVWGLGNLWGEASRVRTVRCQDGHTASSGACGTRVGRQASAWPGGPPVLERNYHARAGPVPGWAGVHGGCAIPLTSEGSALEESQRQPLLLAFLLRGPESRSCQIWPTPVLCGL